jgi:hypothetical protein
MAMTHESEVDHVRLLQGQLDMTGWWYRTLLDRLRQAIG